MSQAKLSKDDVLRELQTCEVAVTAHELAFRLDKTHGRSVYPQLKALEGEGLAVQFDGKTPRWLSTGKVLPFVADAFRVLIAWYRSVHPKTAELLELDFEAFQRGITPRELAGEG